MLKIENLSLTLNKKKLLKEIYINLNEKEYFVLLGATGSGKTLFLESLAGLYDISGKISFHDRDITKLPIEKRRLGIVYQDLSLFPHLNVFDNLAFPLKMQKKFKENTVYSLAEKLSITHLLNRNISSLSGGEKQKTAIARALLSDAVLLLLDEPFSALDYAYKKEMYQFIKSVHDQFSLTTIHITHHFEEAMDLADQIAVIQEGEIIQTGSPYEIFRFPKTRYVAEFVGTDNILNLVHHQNNTYIESTEIALSSFSPHNKYAVLHASDIIISREIIKSSARFCLKAKIKDITDRINFIEIVAEIDHDLRLPVHCKITRQSLDDLKLETNQYIYLVFKESALHLI